MRRPSLGSDVKELRRRAYSHRRYEWHDSIASVPIQTVASAQITKGLGT
ncbi:MAG: hypothetical protein ABW318_10785 [Vicinamibacterales bacterium]